MISQITEANSESAILARLIQSGHDELHIIAIQHRSRTELDNLALACIRQR